jgi:hypothetical protein
MTRAEQVIRWTTATAVIGVAAVAATASYEHTYAAWGGGMDDPAGSADGRRADLRQVDGDARLRTPGGAGSDASAGSSDWASRRRWRRTSRTAKGMA